MVIEDGALRRQALEVAVHEHAEVDAGTAEALAIAGPTEFLDEGLKAALIEQLVESSVEGGEQEEAGR